MGRRILIVGGVAGGATAAAHARRLSEDAEIIILERGPYVSFANCGLPYYIGGEIPEKEDLLVQTPEGLRSRFNLDVRVMSEVIELDPSKKRALICDLKSHKNYWESYDDLIISTGASPLKPRIPGIDREGLFSIRGITDVEVILQWINEKKATQAVVVGGGFIGVEMVEQLHKKGLDITLAEGLPQVMAPFDPEMAAWLHHELNSKGVKLHLDDPVASFDNPEPNTKQATVVELKSGVRIPADIVILAIGVRPESELIKNADLEIGDKGGIRVSEDLRTSDPHIWAIGDAIEVRDFVTGEWVLVPLAGPANRQGRMVAENIFGGSMKYSGTCGTSILRCFDMVAACTGANEKTLKRNKITYAVVHLHPASHANYYPGAERIAMKILFDPDEGRLLGAQVLGKDGVDKRIDVLATALKSGLTVHDLEELELAYAPPFGAAKDPVNLAGMVAQHVKLGEVQCIQWHEIATLAPEATTVLDVRDEDEREEGYIPGSTHIPLPELRLRLDELSKDKEIITYCQTGQRSYFAFRILVQNGFRVRNLTGSYLTWKMAHDA
ncbi:MAG: pyridine nucleotide-disulfide oxidoreductase family protein [Nitrospina sp.]|jgi:NADPH-dependent 2,4-dienoyl-CoA reductase/sulfur reductase-like enzyme/rhodanese-related sulfurtransferase|nr:pyridine nucleotide-disulfide oxidoreductase family protein [Nitrospina sp.]MBT5631313.1 pyridine nucleotide-disulfide oxidoreductase family protein [Nitrospina sp.]